MISEFNAGDTKQYEVQVLDASGVPIDITTGYQVWMTLKLNQDDPDATPAPGAFQFSGVITDGINGKAVVTLPSDQTKLMTVGSKYFYDFQVNDNSVPPIVTTLESSSVRIGPNITVADA